MRRKLRVSCSTIELPAHESFIVSRLNYFPSHSADALRSQRALTPQFFRDFVRHEARPLDVLRFKGDRRDARVSATAVLFRKARQVVLGGIRIPGIAAHGNF